MKQLLIISIVLLLNGCVNHSENKGIIENVKSETDTNEFTYTIDTEKHIFGIPFGTTEQEVINDYGKPYGYIRLNKQDTVMLYTSSSALFFTDKKLSGVRIAHGIIDYELAKRLPVREYWNIPWRLSNGVKSGMPLSEVKKILGDKLSGDKYLWSYQTDSTTVSLSFSRRQGNEENDNAYSLHSMTLEKK